MLSKRHFVQFANIVRGQHGAADGPAARETLRRVALKLADLGKAENPRFDYQRFYEACGLNNIGTGWTL